MLETRQVDQVKLQMSLKNCLLKEISRMSLWTSVKILMLLLENLSLEIYEKDLQPANCFTSQHKNYTITCFFLLEIDIQFILHICRLSDFCCIIVLSSCLGFRTKLLTMNSLFTERINIIDQNCRLVLNWPSKSTSHCLIFCEI